MSMYKAAIDYQLQMDVNHELGNLAPASRNEVVMGLQQQQRRRRQIDFLHPADLAVGVGGAAAAGGILGAGIGVMHHIENDTGYVLNALGEPVKKTMRQSLSEYGRALKTGGKIGMGIGGALALGYGAWKTFGGGGSAPPQDGAAQ